MRASTSHTTRRHLRLVPDLTYIADKLTRDNMVIRIVNGGNNMPAFGSSLKPQELDALVAFLESRKRPLRPQDQSPIARN
jgi:mono/diheme cytochrome c family protein